LEAELRTIIDDHRNHLKWGCFTSEQYYRFKGTLDARMKVGQENMLVPLKLCFQTGNNIWSQVAEWAQHD
jgi:hypothetical protein